MSALANRLRESFARELHADAARQRGRIHDHRAARVVPRAFEKWERLARAEEAQRIIEIVRRDELWSKDSRLDQWVERIYCATIGMGSPGGAAAAIPLGPVDVLGGAGTVVGYLQGELGVTIATGVSGWASQIGGATLDLSQAGTTQQPIRTVNDATLWGRTTITSDGTNDVLNATWNPSPPGTIPIWVRTIMSRASTGTSDVLYCGGSGVLSTLFGSSSTAMRAYNATNGTTITVVRNTWFRTENLFNNAATDYLKIGATSVTGVNTGNSDPTAFRLFAGSTVGVAPGGYSIQKALVLSSAPSSLQKALFDAIDTRFYNGNISL